jgi:hypothetical protein
MKQHVALLLLAACAAPPALPTPAATRHGADELTRRIQLAGDALEPQIIRYHLKRTLAKLPVLLSLSEAERYQEPPGFAPYNRRWRLALPAGGPAPTTPVQAAKGQAYEDVSRGEASEGLISLVAQVLLPGLGLFRQKIVRTPEGIVENFLYYGKGVMVTPVAANAPVPAEPQRMMPGHERLLTDLNQLVDLVRAVAWRRTDEQVAAAVKGMLADFDCAGALAGELMRCNLTLTRRDRARVAQTAILREEGAEPRAILLTTEFSWRTEQPNCGHEVNQAMHYYPDKNEAGGELTTSVECDDPFPQP